MNELSATPAVPPSPAAPRRHPLRAVVLTIAGAAVLAAVGYAGYAVAFPADVPEAVGEIVENLTGANPHPVVLKRPVDHPLSAVALLGKSLFFDPMLSASGKMSCASCHSPAHAYGPPNDLDVQLGGRNLDQQGYRPPPSLMYLNRQPNFSIGPDAGENDAAPTVQQLAAQNAGVVKAQKTAGGAAPVQMVPQGGLFWDGRADTLQQQAFGPLLNSVEMANPDIDGLVTRVAGSKYATTLKQMFGDNVFNDPRLAASEIVFAIARYQFEDPSFHPYNSKYDRWLEGKARLSHAELNGLRLFNDPDKANCAGCHLSKPSPEGLPPMFTDYQYEALGVPRNHALAQNKDPAFYDIGVCGPFRTDLKDQSQYCSMFLTPTLRNAATRQVFFHNGIYHDLQHVMDFYNARNTDPGKFYPRGPDGKIEKYDDVPARYQANVDVTDAPFDRKFGDTPAMTQADIQDIIAFLHTLDDDPKPH
ncbi:cytochrome-c peroxidase [Burkholderia plantarii]|uniref:cytochrome-c peroxidase n=1 Tax=Burkholderia plantarii TaxID=41899 RepID=UPI00272AFBAE|nr:cytochrome c peroxidase [Burkholderia plantarii]WLE62608.1 cytochrome-c peroxidase [Burkholderia plantarii]